MRSLFDDVPTGAEESPHSDSGPALASTAPLAERLRPTHLDEVVGQEEVVGPQGFLRRAIEGDRLPSMILWGPPGTGKTTLAQLAAQATSCRFVPFSAVTSGIKDVKLVMADAARFREAEAAAGHGRRTLLFVDEIHRFNRAQQDAFLPYVERGDIILVGATTENPSFEINGALLSRCRVVVLSPLSSDDLKRLLRRALDDDQRGLGALLVADEEGGKPALEVLPEALDSVAQLSSGDARKALNLLEQIVIDVVAGDRSQPLDASSVERLVQRKVLLYDKSGEEHYNLISALHKSLRDSDADAALYWLARMLEAGEDPGFIARRLVRFASEDIGLADPRALRQTLDAWEAYERLGSPEGELAIAQATLYLAVAAKSNAVYKALGEARKTVAERPADPVPKALRNAPTSLMKKVGYGAGYVYAHDTAEGTAGLDCLPDALQGTIFYRPTGNGTEGRIGPRLEELRRLRQDVGQRSRQQSKKK